MASHHQVQNTKTEKSSPSEAVLALESGTSLAEFEHTSDTAPVLDHDSPQQHKRADTSVNSIDSLRSELASDVLTSHPFQTFTSPFEVPTSKKSNNSDRYLKVPLVYCDQTASNRPVRSIERYMEHNCLPLYGNTHTNTSVTGSQSTAFVAEARQIVAEASNAKITGKASLDVVLFAGNGTTSAVELLIDCLGLKHAASTSSTDRPVVFVGPYEHHSNLLPWRESGCEIVMIPECRKTQSVDMLALEKVLQSPQYANRLKMGTFTAASNVTGKICDVDQIAATLHRHGALAFFDYATGAAYLPMNMNPAPSQSYPSASLVSKDAIFLSPHKMLGGVGTPGVLIVKKHLVQQVTPPNRSGGGTVFYVTNTHHRFLSNRIERYEGGTPNVSGIIRTGLTFLLKRKVEERYSMLHDQATTNGDAKNKAIPQVARSLQEYECETHARVVQALKETAPNLVLLGGGESTGPNLPIFPFLIKCGKRFLHYNYVCAILNDVFGIQSRGGCQCSGPYSQRLLGLTTVSSDGVEVPNESNEQIEHALVHYKERAELLRPGYTRLSLPFKGLRKEEEEYVLKALEWVAKHGWALMCQYRCNHRTGEWRHFSRQGKPLGRTERKWLSHYDILEPPTDDRARPMDEDVTLMMALERALANADALLEAARSDQRNKSQALNMNDANSVLGSDEEALEDLRWYVYPKECAKWLSEGRTLVPDTHSDIILGAVRPITYSLSVSKHKDDGTIVTRQVMNECSIQKPLGAASKVAATALLDAALQTPGRKRKKPAEGNANPTDGSPGNAIPVHVRDAPMAGNGTCESSEPNGSSLFTFRDGEHTGEALLDDLEAGLDDGELTGQCDVFDPRADRWISIVDFLRSSKKTKIDDRGSGGCNQRVASEANGDGCGEKEETSPPLNEETINSSKKTVGKKAPRDSSTWGERCFLQPKATPDIIGQKVGSDGSVTNGKHSVSDDSQQVQTSQGALRGETSSLSQEAIGLKKNRRGRGVKPPQKMMRYITQAMIQWNMVEEGDKLLLGLSGGKDSMSLLHCLLEYQRKMPINFTIEVCTIDPMTASFDPSPLIPYVEALGLKYHYIRDDIVSRASTSGRDGKVVSSLCAFCARMKRGNLYTCARKNNCNKLVLAQHLDDCAESFLMSVMHNGFLRTMKAHYQINAGDLSVIRPMVYCRESLMTAFAKEANLPVINENCPACFEEPKERARIKKLLSREETLYPNIYDNIRRSLIPLLHEDATAILRCYTEEAVSKSRKGNNTTKKSPKNKKTCKGKNDYSGDQANVSHSGATPALHRSEVAVTEKAKAAHNAKNTQKLLHEASEEELLMELARRKAERFRLSGSMGRLETDDPTGQVCTLKGGDGSIPCRELME